MHDVNLRPVFTLFERGQFKVESTLIGFRASCGHHIWPRYVGHLIGDETVINVQLHLDARHRRGFIHGPARDRFFRSDFGPATEVWREDKEIITDGDSSDDNRDAIYRDKQGARA